MHNIDNDQQTKSSTGDFDSCRYAVSSLTKPFTLPDCRIKESRTATNVHEYGALNLLFAGSGTSETCVGCFLRICCTEMLLGVNYL